MKPITVTAIVATFNRGELLVECLEAILAQTRPADDIIIVVDGSTDNTLALLKPYEDRVRVLSKHNQGKAAALNLGMKQAAGDFVWICDDDDIAAPNALEILVGLLEANPHADIAYGRHERFSTSPSGAFHNIGTGYWRSCDPDEFLIVTLDDMFAHQQGMIVRRSLYQHVGPFNEQLIRSQDYEMLIRLARVGTPVSTEDTVFFQRIHNGIRGNEVEQIAAEKQEAAWSQFDKEIFKRLYSELTLDEYLGRGQTIFMPADKRRALIRRASIMSRKKLWKLAVQDLREAEATSRDPLSQTEIASLRSAFASKYGCDEILDNTKLIDKLCELAQLSPIGSDMVAALARGLRWKVRSALFEPRPHRSVGYLRARNRLSKASSMRSREMSRSMRPHVALLKKVKVNHD
jgi:glycosyltransferase involved in cell wall biosynthesis